MGRCKDAIFDLRVARCEVQNSTAPEVLQCLRTAVSERPSKCRCRCKQTRTRCKCQLRKKKHQELPEKMPRSHCRMLRCVQCYAIAVQNHGRSNGWSQDQTLSAGNEMLHFFVENWNGGRATVGMFQVGRSWPKRDPGSCLQGAVAQQQLAPLALPALLSLLPLPIGANAGVEMPRACPTSPHRSLSGQECNILEQLERSFPCPQSSTTTSQSRCHSTEVSTTQYSREFLKSMFVLFEREIAPVTITNSAAPSPDQTHPATASPV